AQTTRGKPITSSRATHVHRCDLRTDHATATEFEHEQPTPPTSQRFRTPIAPEDLVFEQDPAQHRSPVGLAVSRVAKAQRGKPPSPLVTGPQPWGLRAWEVAVRRPQPRAASAAT